MNTQDTDIATDRAPPTSAPRAVPHWLWVAGILLLAFGLRAAKGASRDGIWRDEAQDWYVVTESDTYGDLLANLRYDGHPPLHYLMEKVVLDVFGTSMAHLVALQVVIGTILVGLIVLLGSRCFGRPTGYLAGLLTATSPFFIFYSTQPRNYTLFGVLSVLHALAFLRFLKKPRGRTAALWGAAAAAMMLTNYYAIHLIVAAGTFWLLRERSRRGFLLAVMAGAACVAVFSPWLPSFLAQIGQDMNPWAWPKVSSKLATETLRIPFGRRGAGILWAGLFLGIAALRYRTAEKPAPVVAFTALWFLGLMSGLTGWLLQLHHGPFNPRYLIGGVVCVLPAGCFIFAQCLSGGIEFRRRRLLKYVGAVAVALAVLGQWSTKTWTRPTTAMKSLVERLEQEERSGDLVWIGFTAYGSSFNFHYRGVATVITPPYRKRVTRVVWDETATRLEDGPLLETFFEQVEAQLDLDGRVWVVANGYISTSPGWAFREGRSPGYYAGARLPHAQYHIHRRLMRLLFAKGILVERTDWPPERYFEPAELILFRARVPGDPPLADLARQERQ